MEKIYVQWSTINEPGREPVTCLTLSHLDPRETQLARLAGVTIMPETAADLWPMLKEFAETGSAPVPMPDHPA